MPAESTPQTPPSVIFIWTVSPHSSLLCLNLSTQGLFSALPDFSVKNLHDRWAKDCATYRDLYDQVQDLELLPKIGWTSLLDDKLVMMQHQLH